ncbi:unnamed protein product, partial [Staurois parvus]
LVPCDLCDHSQISHVVSNDVRSDILLTTIHVITDWPITLMRSRTAISIPFCVWRTQQGVCTNREARRTFINGHLPLHCSRPAVYIHGPDRKWL